MRNWHCGVVGEGIDWDWWEHTKDNYRADGEWRVSK